MQLKYEPKFQTPFSEVCQRGFASGIPCLSQNGYQADTTTWMKSGDGIFFGKGGFDEWAVWVGRYAADGTFGCCLPRDVYYFEIFANLGAKYGNDNVYSDAYYLYDRVPVRQSPSHVVRLNPVVLSDIQWLSRHYMDSDDALWAERAFLSTYYGMIAEENKKSSQLGAAVKINGLYNILKAGMPIETAARCHDGVSAAKIYAECVEHHIFRDFPD